MTYRIFGAHDFECVFSRQIEALCGPGLRESQSPVRKVTVDGRESQWTLFWRKAGGCRAEPIAVTANLCVTARVLELIRSPGRQRIN